MTTSSEQQAGAMLPQTTEAATVANVIVVLCDELDRDLWNDLAIHLDTLAVRLGDAFVWKSYCFPRVAGTQPSEYRAFFQHLHQAVLFLPCTSPTFLTHFWTWMQSDPRHQALLASIHVQPIPLRMTHGVEQTLLPAPLAAYEGHSRDEACAQIVAFIERILLTHLAQRQDQVSRPGLVARIAQYLFHQQRAQSQATRPRLLQESPRLLKRGN